MATQISIDAYHAAKMARFANAGTSSAELRELLRPEMPANGTGPDVDDLGYDQLLACQTGILKYLLGVVAGKIYEANDDPQGRIDRETAARLAADCDAG